MHASATQALLEGEHPYGVQPEGNLLQECGEGRSRKNLLDASLGTMRRLDDAGNFRGVGSAIMY